MEAPLLPFGSTFSVRIPAGLYPSQVAMIASDGLHTRHEDSLGAIEQVYRANNHPYATNVRTTRAGICRKRIDVQLHCTDSPENRVTPECVTFFARPIRNWKNTL